MTSFYLYLHPYSHSTPQNAADNQAGFSAGWSAKPEKTVPIAKSILEIRQALNVSLFPIFLFTRQTKTKSRGGGRG